MFVLIIPVGSFEPQGVVEYIKGIKVTFYNVTLTAFDVDIILPCRYTASIIDREAFILTWQIDGNKQEPLYHISRGVSTSYEVADISNIKLVKDNPHDGNVDLQLRIKKSSRLFKSYLCFVTIQNGVPHDETKVYG